MNHGCERIVTLRDPNSGGDSSTVQHQLTNVQQISGTPQAFAAILADGTVVTWGNPHFGGDSSEVQDQLKNVQQICGADCGDSSEVQGELMYIWNHLDAKWERVVPVELPRFIDPKVVVWLSGWVQIQDCKTCLLLGILPIPIPI